MTWIFLFGSIHKVMRDEKPLKTKGMEVDLIPVPREIRSDCGVAVELPGPLRGEALGLLEEYRCPIRGAIAGARRVIGWRRERYFF